MFKIGQSSPRKQTLVAGLLAVAGVMTSPLVADCLSLVKGPMVLDVKSCLVIDPVKTFDMNLERYKFIGDLPPVDRQKFYDSYRGLFIKALVARSDAERSGLSPEKGILMGQTIGVFVPPGVAACGALKDQRIAVLMNQACCEGGGQPPCLLTSSYTFKEFKIAGKASTNVIERRRQQKSTSPEQKEADRLLAKKDFAGAAKVYEKLREERKLDILGNFHLGLTYRELDQCTNAVAPLTFVHDRMEHPDLWADEEPVIRRAALLLARCYSKLNRAEKAVIILNGFLLDPQRFEKEIHETLRHKDFGWIRTTKEYQTYTEDAHRALQRIPPKL